ncbi:hypothetical protein [Pseudomonas syringae group genomosp. 7]|uniref:hypothetical protein n=1 Tax=Pseudomonas syringae group genomosp. 7 TaxID=251699 RepID=UPI0037704F92
MLCVWGWWWVLGAGCFVWGVVRGFWGFWLWWGGLLLWYLVCWGGFLGVCCWCCGVWWCWFGGWGVCGLCVWCCLLFGCWWCCGLCCLWCWFWWW